MAILTDPERDTGYAEWMRDPAEGEEFTIVKADLRAAYAAVDDWIDAAASSYNSALPQPFRGAASAKLKAYLLARVLRDRYDLGSF